MPFHLLPSVETEQVSRRGFLKGLTVGAASLALGRSGWGAEGDDPNAWFALVSDTHIAADRSTVARDQTMAENLRMVVAEILDGGEPPRGVVIDGDLALRDGQAGDYQTFLDLLAPLRRAAVPLHLGLGNHDDRDHFRRVLEIGPDGSALESKHVSVIEDAGLRWVVLDSLDKVNVTPGLLGDPQLGWLADRLDAQPDRPTVVFVHHNPDTRASSGLTDTEALMTVLRPRKQVKALVFGHTHVWSIQESDGIHLINLPAVGYPFSDNQPIGWVRFRPRRGGAELELRAIGGDRGKHGQRVALQWRS